VDEDVNSIAAAIGFHHICLYREQGVFGDAALSLRSAFVTAKHSPRTRAEAKHARAHATHHSYNNQRHAAPNGQGLVVKPRFDTLAAVGPAAAEGEGRD